ncbi:MAG: PEGA domain-containing protein [Treponema sp.]|nr:PEGA domain-containing protein [Candidatus Treponema equifaecale]
MEIAEDKTEISIRCNTAKASVYINGEYQGKTELKIKNLREGTYSLKVTKKGHKSEEYEIQVEKGLRQNFYVELKKSIMEL